MSFAQRTISWLKGLRRLRLRLRHDRLGVIIDAWTTLAANVICFRILHHDAIYKVVFCQSLIPRRADRDPQEFGDC
jgi:hypothetical protein